MRTFPFCNFIPAVNIHEAVLTGCGYNLERVLDVCVAHFNCSVCYMLFKSGCIGVSDHDCYDLLLHSLN